MQTKTLLAILQITLILNFCAISSAEMASDSYRIQSSVHSAGGLLSNSANYQANGTVGQSSPLVNSLEPPMSDSYDLYAGFWYTLPPGLEPCDDLSSFAGAFGSTNLDGKYNISCDSEPDGDVDGVDLVYFLK